MSKELTVYDFDTTQRVSVALYKSGYFTDVQSEAQAIVKVMAGQELGLPPFASMTGIHIIKGKPVLGSNVIATLVKNDPRYNFVVTQADSNACMIDWYENGKRIGSAGFSMAEAKTAGLAGKQNWKAYPSDMLFARAISRGARRFAPGIFGGAPVYTPDEMGADVDPDGYVEGEIVSNNNEHIADRILAHSQAGNEPRGAYDPGGTDFHYEPPDDEPDDDAPSGNGAKVAAHPVDARAWLEEKITNGSVNCGLVADAVVMTGLYNDREHVRNALAGYDWTAHGASDDFTVDFRQKWTKKAALSVFDWLMDRKIEEAREQS